MIYHERVGALHIHTTRSDGSLALPEVARAANRAGLDFIVITDHNAYAPGEEGWYGDTLVLVGEELHDPRRPNENHLLVLAAGEDLAPSENQDTDPQRWIEAARQRGGLSYLAHPVEVSGGYSGEPEINWTRWDVSGYDGLEIWNYMSEFKSYVTELGTALLYSLFPRLAIRGPFPEALSRWDTLLAERKVYALGGVDAHGTVYRLGPIRKQVFGYEHLFRSLTTHVLLDEPWSGSTARDAAQVIEALRLGRSFVVYEPLGSGRGFRFTAQSRNEIHALGDEFLATGPVRLHMRVPRKAHLRLLLNGHPVAVADGTELVHESRAPGAYRAEAYRYYPFRRRMWILSNPIFVRTARAALRAPTPRAPDPRPPTPGR